MKIKTKNHEYKILFVLILIILCLSIIFCNNNMIEVCHAISSWNPTTGFQPGISADIGTSTDTILFSPDISALLGSDGILNAYSSLKVKNDKINTTYGGWKHASFVEYFTIKRTDGRNIYDDDGILDVSWWNDDGTFGYSNEVIDYQSEIWVKTTLAPYNYNGFLGSVLNSKWKDNAKFEITWDRGQDAEDTILSAIHDKNANNMGSGNYRNSGVNPSDENYKLCDTDYCSSPYITITLNGTAYWENGWWGGAYDYTDISAFLSGFMARKDRDWSNTLTAESAIQVGNNFYSAKPFVAIASNLNNYIKLNDKKVTPKTDQNVLPFSDGFHIAITDDGKTKVSIENGKENQYSDYNCIVDTKIPDINLVYLNTNGLDRLKESTVVTNSDGSKSQTLTGGIFKDQVQVNFGADENESPEKCLVTFNGNTKEIASGIWLSEAGDYSIVVQDLVGNSKTINFTIDTQSPTENISSLANDKTYKVSKWYLTSIPYGFNDYGTYSYLTYDEALSKAKQSERQNLVTTYTLENISDFHFTNLVASGDTIKVGTYYYYKSKDNKDLYVYYFTESLLDEAIEKYAKGYVSSPQYFNYKSDIYPNDYGTIINNDIYQNTWNENKIPAYVANNFIFRQSDEQETYKIFYDYIDDGQNTWTEFVYNISFKEQAVGHGLYLIKEMDYVGHETYCYVFLDLQAPALSVTAKVYGENESFTHTISSSDIPANGELIFYYENFAIDNVIENDTWYVLQIKDPNGIVTRYTHDDTLPNFNNKATGEYTITAYDRISNAFSFKVCLLGKSPKVKFETINANTQMRLTITSGEEYNEITDLKIYRNEIVLNSDLGYDEYPNDDNNELIYINSQTRQCLFNKGGLYKVEITDNFGRTTTHEFKFEKDLPIGILKGVKDGDKTNGNVSFIFDSTKYAAQTFANDSPITIASTTDNNLSTLNFEALENIDNHYKIILSDNSDFENINIYQFTIRTIPPKLTLYGVTDSGTTSTDVYASWEIQSGYLATYKKDYSQELSYLNGQILTAEGVYTVILKDELGNQNSVTFEIDKSLSYTIYKDNTISNADEIRYTNSSIQIVNSEPLNIEIQKDNISYPYSFGNYFNDEGFYLVKIYDDFGNVKYFEFEIDKTCPEAELIGVTNNGTTSGIVQVVWTEENLTATIYCDETSLGNYTSGSEIKLNGTYEIKVYDRAGNFVKFNFQIDNKIEFEINTFKDGISNGGVRVIAKEELAIQMYKDGESIDYAFEQILNDDGFYQFILTDNLGNKTLFSFTILNKPIMRIEKKLDDSVTITEITKNDELQELDIQNNTLYLVDEGLYKVSVFDKTENKNFTFNLEIDTTPPTIELVGVKNGGQTKSEVTTKNASENPIYILASNNSEEFEYSLGQKMENVGTYKLIVSDEAGNKTQYDFTIMYALNGASIALFGALLAVVVIIIIFLVKNKIGYYKNKQEITTVEETTEEIESIEKK